MKYEGRKIVYEVGDFVMPLERVSHWNRNNSFPARIKGIYGNCADCGKYQDSCAVVNLRPATQEEIDKVEDKIMVGEYEVVFPTNGCDVLAIGCVNVSKKLFLKIGKRAGWK